MSKNFKWNKGNDNRTSEQNDLRVVLFVSRNKDNKDIEGFKERKRAFVAWFDGYNAPNWVNEEFKKFYLDGQKDEISRMYVSVNKRDEIKVKRELARRLVDDVLGDGKVELTHLDAIVAAIAAKSENRAESHWLFDYDGNLTEIDYFAATLYIYSGGQKPRIIPTKNGYAVIVDHGFDTRKMMEAWPEVGLKRDDLLLISYAKKLTDDGKTAFVSALAQEDQREIEKTVANEIAGRIK